MYVFSYKPRKATNLYTATIFVPFCLSIWHPLWGGNSIASVTTATKEQARMVYDVVRNLHLCYILFRLSKIRMNASTAFHHANVLIFTPLLSEGQAGKAWEHSNNVTHFLSPPKRSVFHSSLVFPSSKGCNSKYISRSKIKFGLLIQQFQKQQHNDRTHRKIHASTLRRIT
jgi:hypothetical protein